MPAAQFVGGVGSVNVGSTWPSSRTVVWARYTAIASAGPAGSGTRALNVPVRDSLTVATRRYCVQVTRSVM